MLIPIHLHNPTPSALSFGFLKLYRDLLSSELKHSLLEGGGKEEGVGEERGVGKREGGGEGGREEGGEGGRRGEEGGRREKEEGGVGKWEEWGEERLLILKITKFRKFRKLKLGSPWPHLPQEPLRPFSGTMGSG